MDEIKRTFERYDVDGNGYISLTEAHQVLHEELGFTQDNTRKMIAVYDRDGDAKLNFEEFIWFYWKIIEKKDELLKMFAKFDVDGSQSISYEEARGVMKDFNFKYSDSEIKQLMASFDQNKDGHLQFQEFVHFWTALGGKIPGK